MTNVYIVTVIIYHLTSCLVFVMLDTVVASLIWNFSRIRYVVATNMQTCA